MSKNSAFTAGEKLAVIIPHYNDGRRLAACLEALAPQVKSAANVDVVVVDNGSTEDLSSIEARFGFVRFVNEGRKGAAAARNSGVKATSAHYLAFLDCDCVPNSDWLAQCRRLAGKDDLAGGEVTTFDETPPPRSGAEAFEAVFAFHQRSYIERKGFSVTANLLTSRAVFDDVGPLTVGLAEDIEWCWRARSKGYTLVYRPDLKVSHPTRSDWSALAKKWRRTTDETFRLNGTGPAARAKWLIRAVAVLGSVVVHLPRVLTDRALRGPRERWRAAATLIRLRATRFVWMLRQALTGR